jgi:predicted enzyme related to lactoylglutathione lyase
VERVEGIGGVFFRSEDPKRLAAWYAEQLGIDVEEWGGSVFQARDADVTAWSPFAADTDYWPAGQQGMVNYRVRDLDAMLAQLRASGVEVDERVEETENGRFAWAVDLEGNRFELWQPR